MTPSSPAIVSEILDGRLCKKHARVSEWQGTDSEKSQST